MFLTPKLQFDEGIFSYRFGPMPLLESVHQLLQKEVGLVAQKQAVHLLFLLLNC